MLNKYIPFLVLSFCALTFSINAQTKEERTQTITAVNKTALVSFQKTLDNRHTDSEKKVDDYLRKYPLLKRSFVKANSVYYLQRIDADGNPVYINTKNKDSGILIKADQLYTGGSIGVNITGQNMVAGIWDGGQVRATHELLSGQVAMQAGQTLDGSAENYKGNNHQTHVSGTMVGKNIANQPSARGIAFGATAQNYDWANDKTEMTAFASNGFLISNHSYGYANDTTISVWKFGAYDSEAQAWDIIAKNAPNYLPFVAVGNEQQPADNGNNSKLGYDLITGSAAAKNVMTVGAVNGDKTMSTYSNWGPTDDGRVKPEIVARGTGINSSLFANETTNLPSDNSYSGNGVGSSGTSYATPAVAAAGLLLQQYYNSLYGNYMKAATLKALMLGTADDLGQSGPDHKFGWGLLNVERAANAIKYKSATGSPASQIRTDVTTKGAYIEEITYNIPNDNSTELIREVFANGCDPLIVSIAWTDDEGTEQTSANGTDPTASRLVHNFDFMVRNINNASLDARPWKPSTMANRTANATIETDWFDGNGNNYKQVKINNPVAGQLYRIYVRKSTTSPNTAKPFSLVITGTQLATPTAVAQTFCSGKTVADLVTTSGTNIKWYDAQTGGNLLPSSTALTTRSYYASQTVNGCESSRLLVNVTVNSSTTPSVNITPIKLCEGATQTLTATPTNGGTPTYLWKKNNINLVMSQNITIVNAVANDVYAVTMTPSANACPNTATATASITVSAKLPAPTTNPISYNQGATAVPLTATASANNTLLWYGVAATGGTSSTSAPIPSTNVAGSTTYYVSQTNATSCESNRSSLVVTINSGTPAPTGPASQTFCSDKTVADLKANGTAVQWYATATGGKNVLSSNTVLVNGTVYYASQTVSGIESFNRLAVTATVNLIPIITVGASTNPTPPNVADGSIAFTCNLANGNYPLIYSSTGSPKNVNVSGGAFTLSGLVSGIYGAFTLNNNGCFGKDASVRTLITPVTNVMSITTGNWESNTTWNVGRPPQAGDVVTISANHTVTINANGTAKDMDIRGILNYATTGIVVNLGL